MRTIAQDPPIAGTIFNGRSASTRTVWAGRVLTGIACSFSASTAPAGFSILRARSLDEAIEWASRQAQALGDVEVDIRPVTEPWDIGMGPRPRDVTTHRYMVLRKASAATEAGLMFSSAQRTELSRLIEETPRTGVHLVTETMRPSARAKALQELPRRHQHVRRAVHRVQGAESRVRDRIGGVSRGRGSMGDAVHRGGRCARGGRTGAGVI